MPKTRFENPFKEKLELKRFPESSDESLQAWDSADELLLQHLRTVDLEQLKILILNDAYGALTCALEAHDPVSYTDSYLSHEAIRRNGGRNARLISDLSRLSGTYDLVLIKIPKTTSFLEDMLCRVSGHLHSESKVIAAARLKHLPFSAFALLNRIIGKTSTSLAEKKARLIFADFENKECASPYPTQVKIENFSEPFFHQSNLFSREKLDIGTRFFLAHLPKGNFKRILDLGCGNGIVGIAAKKLNPGAELYFSDESAMAIESAKVNFNRFTPGPAHFYWTNCFEAQTPAMLDLVLCNPPFHQGNTLESTTAEQMFRDARLALAPGGRLWVVGNSHLEYPRQLKQLFGNSRTVATHPKFIITEAFR